MRRMAETYPQYGFEKHKGYGTAAHYAAIRAYGPSPIHRPSFLKKMHRYGGAVKGTKGAWGEECAAAYLRRRGYRILARNYSCRFGEIDIIAADRHYVVFVEVKLRASDRFVLRRKRSADDLLCCSSSYLIPRYSKAFSI